MAFVTARTAAAVAAAAALGRHSKRQETSSDPRISKLDYSTLVQYFRVALYKIGKGVTPPPSYNTLVY